ncbi:MAG: aminomethyl-transferring glycine dehydrogenase, partial [Flavobacteriaceae bacterium]|nr:aminomethyl-transferring glycine dehydrogenase [Flavobacteriaceae bacterium]
MVQELTAMEIANASLLDEGTAIAEAITMAFQSQRQKANKVYVLEPIFPQSLAVVQTRCSAMGIDLEKGTSLPANLDDYCAVVVQYPNGVGAIDQAEVALQTLADSKALSIVCADLLSLAILKPPGEMGADIVVGSSQRFGVPMGFGGPHAAYLATKDSLKRLIPGRIVGVSKDSKGKVAYRLALQTREQHIRREKATSNICTSQVLLAIMASMYAVYHGPKGLRRIASHVRSLTEQFAAALTKSGFSLKNSTFFDTVTVMLESAQRDEILARAKSAQVNLRVTEDESLSVSFDESCDSSDLLRLFEIFTGEKTFLAQSDIPQENHQMDRGDEILTADAFNRYHSETEFLRYIKRLESRDLSLAQAMIPLGSCTMKLNATAEMIPVSFEGFAGLHPFVPLEQAKGYEQLCKELERALAEITGFDAVSLQPNAGSQGEYAGLLAIKRYHESRGDGARNICLIPKSAHGTNPASAVMAGMKVVVVGCDDSGNIDVEDLQAKANQHKESLSALMVTYPSTHGVFEERICEICEIVHGCGGQVYLDGANLNALVGLARPGEFGADVCHMNLHKTFCIPHGGGGPGVGPIGVREHLEPFLPGHSLVPISESHGGEGAVSSAPWGSASILPISWAYIALMGAGGLKRATEVAILNANYIAKRLEGHFPILYRGENGFVAHECIVDFREFKKTAGIEVVDIAKRLIDYGFHSPTMSWPVIGTLMIEPTESESKEELDRFCDAM